MIARVLILHTFVFADMNGGVSFTIDWTVLFLFLQPNFLAITQEAKFVDS